MSICSVLELSIGTGTSRTNQVSPRTDVSALGKVAHVQIRVQYIFKSDQIYRKLQAIFTE